MTSNDPRMIFKNHVDFPSFNSSAPSSITIQRNSLIPFIFVVYNALLTFNDLLTSNITCGGIKNIFSWHKQLSYILPIIFICHKAILTGTCERYASWPLFDLLTPFWPFKVIFWDLIAIINQLCHCLSWGYHLSYIKRVIDETCWFLCILDDFRACRIIAATASPGLIPWKTSNPG